MGTLTDELMQSVETLSPTEAGREELVTDEEMEDL